MLCHACHNMLSNRMIVYNLYLLRLLVWGFEIIL